MNLCWDASQPAAGTRPQVIAKFLALGGEKLFVRGVTYGGFRRDPEGSEFPSPEVVERDFAQMAAHGANAVRTYGVPPRWLLDAAERHGLHVMVGIPWEQHVTFLDDSGRCRSIEERVRAAVRSCTGHPAVLCYVIGNEIPGSIVRWHGPRRIERFLHRLYRAAKEEDPGGLVTYVNYPTTEYLQLPFLDLVCFNVYLESPDRLEAYLARLQNIAGERPLIMAEIGLDSRRHGEEAQARVLDWQVRTAFARGCAGAFVFAWTDEWHRGGYAVEDWDFGLTRRDRAPKPALEAVAAAFREAPFPPQQNWPRISVVVCTYNGNGTIRDCFKGLAELRYPNFEVIVVDDGSIEPIAPQAEGYGFRLLRTANRGLSNARNVGMRAATGEIVAYIDDDAYPDPDWLTYLATTFMRAKHVGVGGPNMAPPGGGRIADCVTNAPGGPVHVLLTDEEAEHIPGCNMAFRKEALEAIGGFDPQFRVAGDDVDVCWRLQQRGWTLGYNAAAMVWHHRRNSVRAYWKQQEGYGRAEALLEKKWPEKYNGAGHVSWAGRVYGKGLTYVLGRVSRIYHGTWGSAPFQSLYQNAPHSLISLLLMPEWYLVILALAALSALNRSWGQPLFALPLLALAAAAPIVQAWRSAGRATHSSPPRSWTERLRLRSLTAFLHLAQPLARLRGRLRYGLSPWRRRGGGFSMPRPRRWRVWYETWRAPNQRLESLEQALRGQGAAVLRGGDYDRWDLEVRSGMFGAARLQMAIEEHGAGRQLARFRVWPRCSRPAILLTVLFVVSGMIAGIDRAPTVSAVFGTIALLLGLWTFRDCGTAMNAAVQSLLPLSTAEVPRMPVQHAGHGMERPSAAWGTGSRIAGAVPKEVPQAVPRGNGNGSSAVRPAWMRHWRPWTALSYSAMIALSWALAFLLRFGFRMPDTEMPLFYQGLWFALATKMPVFSLARLLRGRWWRFVGIVDLTRTFLINLAASITFATVVLALPGSRFQESLYWLDFLLCFLLTVGVPLVFHLHREGSLARPSKKNGKGLLIYGAGCAGTMLVREIRANPRLGYTVVGFLDDDPDKQDAVVMGVPVLGTGREASRIVEQYKERWPKIEEILIAMPSATGQQMREALAHCRASGVPCKTVPSLGELLSGKFLSAQIRTPSVTDLLGRDPIQLDEECIRRGTAGRSILVTGAAGSIGSELCRQLARFEPRRVVAFDQAESELFKLEVELRAKLPAVELAVEVGDICDDLRVEEVMRRHAADAVFHAAAYKHVPMMETHVLEAAKNNVLGTWNVAQAALRNGVSDFLMISSDKAVNPTSVMGVTKRVAELIVSSMPVDPTGGTKFVSVRFGNVLASNGSVVPIFQEQIAAGGPLTVTHPEARRYFMTVREAVQLVLQASTMGKGSEIFVLDMGEPVRIVDLARNMIRLAGLVPDEDIEIRFTGLRPGEKIFEQLTTGGEDIRPTYHEKIKIFQSPRVNREEMEAWIFELETLLAQRSERAVIAHLKRLVPEYQPGAQWNISKPRAHARAEAGSFAQGGMS